MPPAELHRAFADGVIVYFTLTGRDDRGGGVRVPIAIRLDRSVGTASSGSRRGACAAARTSPG